MSFMYFVFFFGTVQVDNFGACIVELPISVQNLDLEANCLAVCHLL